MKFFLFFEFFFYEDLLERAPPLINIPPRSNSIQETLEDIIQKQAKEIQRLRAEIKREKSRCLIAIHKLELKLEEQLLGYSWKIEFIVFLVNDIIWIVSFDKNDEVNKHDSSIRNMLLRHLVLFSI